LIYAVCVPYYSIPEFPPECKIVKREGLLTRDVLLCNPVNSFHIQGGVQFDPHIETMEYINCQPKVRLSIADKMENYDDVKILFRTRRLRIDGRSDVLVTGYYLVGSASETEMCRDAPVIKALRARFVTANDAIDITALLDRTRAYRSCFTTENPEWGDRLRRWIQQIDKRRDATKKYVKEIRRLKRVYGKNEFRIGPVYGACGDCPHGNSRCCLFRRRDRYGSPPDFPRHYQ
jgi:hypothetical protein